MAEAAISSLVQVLGDVVIEKVKSLHGVEGQVVLLKKELERMQAFLIDANKKQYEDQRVRQWISEIREMAQDAQDTIETFLINVENKKNEGLLKKCMNFPKSLNHLDRIGAEIASILENLEAIKRSRDTYGIKDLGEAAVVSAAQVEGRRRQLEQRPVGLEDDVRMLLQKSILDEERRGLSIAVVEGMGGIGKSTLARKIYNHPDVVGGRFECRAWVVVSSEFAPHETIKQLILELAGLEKNSVREEIKKLVESTKDILYLKEKLQQMLHKHLLEQTYFIVLDDVWEEQHWEFLRDAFPTTQQDKKSRLLITSRNSRMSKYGQYSHKMKVLSPEKSWELLLNKAFVDGKCPKKLETVGRQILEKCNGLPLAITVVGGLLLGTQSKRAWEQVLDQINSLLGMGDSSVLSILELSYQNLSPQLKSCFLCLALFKEDAIISMRRLIYTWVGQGLIQQEGIERVEETARGYLDELINRNMVEIKDMAFDYRVRNCQVHDLVRKLCLRKANEEIGLEILKAEKRTTTSTSNESLPRKPRHCVAYSENLDSLSSDHNKHVRSLFLVNRYNWITHRSRIWKNFQLLKIVDLDEFGMPILPKCFRALIGLKCLRIHPTKTGLLILPKWFEELKKLEIVDLGDELMVYSVGKMRMEGLRYLRARIFGEDIRIEDWKTIEMLRNVSGKVWMRYSSKLKGSCPIRELGIEVDTELSEYDQMSEDELSRLQASLEKMENLVKLHLTWSLVERPMDAKLHIPQVDSLTKLKLKGRMLSKIPSASVFPPNLSHLTFQGYGLEEDPIEELGKLPKLVFLKFSTWDYNGETMKVLHDGFPCLEVLSLSHITHLRGIDIEEGGMPHLTHLRLSRCHDFNTEILPKQVTISHLAPYQSMIIYTFTLVQE